MFKRRSVASLALAFLTPLLTSCSSDPIPPGEPGTPSGMPTAAKEVETELEDELQPPDDVGQPD